MKTQLILALVGLAIGFALRTSAQQTNTPYPKLRDELVAFFKAFDDAMLNSDAAALAALYTEDGCYVDPTAGPIYGKKAIEKSYADVFQKMRFTKHMIKLEQYSPHIIGTPGNEAWMTGEWSLVFQLQNGAPMQWQGHCLDLCVREGDAWKWRVNTWNAVGPPVPVETNTAPTSSQEQKAVDPQTRQQIQAVNIALDEAWHKHDAAAAAAQYALDAIKVLDWTGGGMLVGREAIEKDFATNFASSPPDINGKVIQLYAIGDQIADISQWSTGNWQGYSSKIYVRDADTWKIRIEYSIGSVAH